MPNGRRGSARLESREGGPARVDSFGAEFLLSKGFAVLTPYIGAGLTYSRGRLGHGPAQLTDNATRAYRLS